MVMTSVHVLRRVLGQTLIFIITCIYMGFVVLPCAIRYCMCIRCVYVLIKIHKIMQMY